MKRKQLKINAGTYLLLIRHFIELFIYLLDYCQKIHPNELGYAKIYIRPLEMLGWCDRWSQTEEMAAEDPSLHLVVSLEREEL